MFAFELDGFDRAKGKLHAFVPQQSRKGVISDEEVGCERGLGAATSRVSRAWQRLV